MTARANDQEIGVVTPSYNQGAFIAETIDSVLGQGYPHLDYWVMDGGSTDDTVEVLKGYGSRVKWVSERDGGQAQAINRGLQRISSAGIVAFVNSDDVYLPGAFESVARYFHHHPEAAWLTGDHYVIDAEGRRIRGYVKAYKRMLRKHPVFRRLALANYIVQPSTFWRRELIEEVGPFDESLRYCFDYDFWMRAIQRHPLHVIDVPLSLFRIHGLSKGGAEFAGQFEEEHRVLKRYTSSRMLLGLHRLHARLIVFAYQTLKR